MHWKDMIVNVKEWDEGLHLNIYDSIIDGLDIFWVKERKGVDADTANNTQETEK